jgi:rare lipoprotein A
MRTTDLNHGAERRYRPAWLVLLSVTIILVTGCASPRRASTSPTAPPAPESRGNVSSPMIGTASYYAHKYHGRTTASGEVFDMHKMTAAHRTLPFGIQVRVTNLTNHRSIVVRINDRGPFVRGRIIDLSLAAAKKLDFVTAGLTQVRIEIVGTKISRR